MPTPRNNESKQDYLKRCMVQVMGEGKDNKQAYAMCNAYWDKAKNQRSALNLTSKLDLSEFKDGDRAREFLITAYTGAKISSWFGDIMIDIPGIQTKEKMPILREHFRDRVVGYGDAWKEDNFYISGKFSNSTQDAKEVMALADEGYPWQASISVRPTKVERLEDKKIKAMVNGSQVEGPLEIWRESKVGEVSFVSLGADDNTAAITMSDEKFSVEILASFSEEPTNNINERKETMDLNDLKKDHPDLLAEIELAAETNGIEKGIVQERERVTQVLSIDGDDGAAKKAIKDGLSLDASYKLFFESEKQKKADALKDLEAQAPESAGQDEPDIETKTKKAPDVELSEKAIQLMTSEKISYPEALDRAMAENPKLKAAYEATYMVQ